MKYEHTVVMTVELTKIFDENHSEDLSRAVQKNMTEWFDLTAMFDDVIFTNCQDFIREEKDATKADWIRFDPEDRLTWPMEDALRGFSAPVITCTDDNCIHIGYIMHFDEDAEAEPTWELSNSVEDISLPLDSVIAWQPLPKPFHMEQEDA